MIKNLKINDGKATALISLSPSDMQLYDIPIFIDDESGDIQRESQIYPILDRVESFFKRINIDDLVFIYYSGSFLPDMEISAQITYEGELENLEIYDK